MPEWILDLFLAHFIGSTAGDFVKMLHALLVKHVEASWELHLVSQFVLGNVTTAMRDEQPGAF